MHFDCFFVDGPAAGVTMTLARGPLLMLRVVENPTGGFDALDLLTDEPRKNETIHVYRCRNRGNRYHVKCSRKSQSGFRQTLNYRHWPNPGDENLRKQEAWSAWCDANKVELEKPE